MKAAFFDVDGTLTNTRVWQGIMRYFQVHRLRQVIHLTFLGYHYPLYFIHRLGLISEARFREPWAAHLAWYFSGYSHDDAEQIWDWILLEFINHHWRMDSLKLLDGHRQEGDLIALVSGGPLPLLKRIGNELGVEHVVGTSFEMKDGRYTGRVSGPVCLDKYKVRLSQAYLLENDIDIDFNASHAYADSISDMPLLEMVGNAVVVHPSEELRTIAQKRGWLVFPIEDSSSAQ